MPIGQECDLLPLVFFILVEEVMQEVKEKFKGEVKIQGEKITMLRLGNDIVLLVEKEKELE